MEKLGEPKLTEAEKNAREEQEKQKQTEKVKKEKQIRLYRKINYYIMRCMWQVIQDTYTNDTIYTCFNMSRTRYARILDTGIARISKEELEFLERKTEIPQEIFKGTKPFACLDEHGNEAISLDEWENLFRLREKRQNMRAKQADGEGREKATSDGEDKKSFEQANKDYKDAERKIKEKLKKIPRKGNDTDFQRLCTFLKNGYGNRLMRLYDIKQAVEQIEFTLLNECTQKELGDLSKLLSQHTKMINAVLLYRKERGDFKRK